MTSETDPTGTAVEPSPREREARIRNAVRDGIIDAVGAVSLLAFALLFVFVGARGIVLGSTILGGAFLVASVLTPAAACNLVPPFRT